MEHWCTLILYIVTTPFSHIWREFSKSFLNAVTVISCFLPIVVDSFELV